MSQWRGQRDEAQRAARLRILEVGGGTGGTTDHLLGTLARSPSRRQGRSAGSAALPVSYHFTDLSAALVQQARRRWPDRTGEQGNRGTGELELVFERLDLEVSPAEQGFPLGQYDLIVAANVLHATADLGGTSRTCRSCWPPAAWCWPSKRPRPDSGAS